MNMWILLVALYNPAQNLIIQTATLEPDRRACMNAGKEIPAPAGIWCSTDNPTDCQTVLFQTVECRREKIQWNHEVGPE